MGSVPREERARIRVDVAYEDPGRQVFLRSLNLSSSGIFLASEEPPDLGAQVRVVLSAPPDGVFLRMQGSVVRHAGPSEPRGFAVAFEGVDERIRGDLRELIRNAETA